MKTVAWMCVTLERALSGSMVCDWKVLERRPAGEREAIFRQPPSALRLCMKLRHAMLNVPDFSIALRPASADTRDRAMDDRPVGQ